MTAPLPVCSAKLSIVGPGQYYGGGPRWNPWCCSYALLIQPLTCPIQLLCLEWTALVLMLLLPGGGPRWIQWCCSVALLIQPLKSPTQLLCLEWIKYFLTLSFTALNHAFYLIKNPPFILCFVGIGQVLNKRIFIAKQRYHVLGLITLTLILNPTPNPSPNPNPTNSLIPPTTSQVTVLCNFRIG